VLIKTQQTAQSPENFKAMFDPGFGRGDHDYLARVKWWIEQATPVRLVAEYQSKACSQKFWHRP
jgi:hypothetical protein